MKNLLLASFLLAATGAVHGQQLLVGTDASLTIRDEKGAPCPDCTLTYNAADGTILGYQQTDSLGTTTVPAALRGRIHGVQVAYRSGLVLNATLASPAVPGQVVALAPPAATRPRLLDEVVVTGHQQLIEDTGEAVVYNAAADIANPGTDATDVLRRTPLVSVDANGAPSIKGSANVKILLNGRAVSYLQPSDLLSQIPSDLITKVEVITSPGAKYDADGSAGVLNIITASPVALNHSGSVNAGAGSKGSHLFASDTYNSRNWSFANGIGLLSFYNETQATQKIDPTNAPDAAYQRTAQGRTNGLSTSYQGTLATLNKKNYLELSVSAFSQTIKPHESFGSAGTPAGLPASQGTFGALTRNTNLSTGLRFDRKFSRNDQVVRAAADYGYLPTTNTIRWEQAGGGYFTDGQVGNTNALHSRSAKLDYEFNLHKKHFFEMGVKAAGNVSEGTSTTVQQSASPTEGQATRTDAAAYRISNAVAGSYLSYKLTLTPRLSSRTGVRYEYTNNHYRVETEAANRYIYQNSNFFPSLGLIYKISNNSTATGNYSYRLQRPQPGFTTPVVSYITSGMKSVGNPYLNPEFSHLFEIGISKYFEANYFRLSAYRTTTSGVINSYSISDGNSLTTTYRNAGTETISGINFWATAYPIKAWSINYGFDFNYRRISNNVISNTGFRLTNTLNTTYRLNDRWAAQFWGNFNTAVILLQGKESSYTFSNISIRHEIMRKKLFASVSLDNPFARRFTQRQQFITPEYASSNEVVYYNRGIRILINYKFGSMKNTATKIKADGMKSGFESMNPESN